MCLKAGNLIECRKFYALSPSQDESFISGTKQIDVGNNCTSLDRCCGGCLIDHKFVLVVNLTQGLSS